jgi:flagellar hook-associated protein 3 FlgL
LRRQEYKSFNFGGKDMGMRITNQMITNNSLRNMQKSLATVNTRTEQMTSGKKISKASEDPVIAIRALKLRTTVDQLYQYKEKNIPDASSWLSITQTSLDNITARVKEIQSYCNQGSTDSFATNDRSAIIDSLKQLQEMIYDEGSATYAGRYIFSGYKTDRSLAFTETEDTTKYSYDITETFTAASIDIKHVVTNAVDDTKLDAYLAGTEDYEQPDPHDVYRLNLAYEDIDNINTEGTGVFNIVLKDADGNQISLPNATLRYKELEDADTYYDVDDNSINVIKETGEIVFGVNVYNAIKQADSIEVSYAKNQVEAGELRPEHYFNCTQRTVQDDGTVKSVDYQLKEGGQTVYYEVNFNQSLQVNTEGNKLITTDVGNNINDLVYALTEMQEAETTQTNLKAMLEDPQYANNDEAVTKINQMLSDIDAEIAVKKENLQKTFSANITNFQNYLDKVSATQSDLGSRMTKLDMITTRVTEQYEEFTELKSQNEDVETEEIIIDFNDANLVYETALAATSNIVQKTLLDYI